MGQLTSSGARIDRRRFLRDGGAAIAGAGVALAGPGIALAGDRGSVASPLPTPKPIPGGLPVGLPAPYDLIHIFLPGPEDVVLPFSGVQLMGLDVEPSTITNRKGTTALTYLIGSAQGGDGSSYDVELDIRVMKGKYRTGGSSHQGLFAMI
jgi:hypothetical protein